MRASLSSSLTIFNIPDENHKNRDGRDLSRF